MSGITFTRLDAPHLPGLTALMRGVYGRRIRPDWLAAKFAGCEASHLPLGCVAQRGVRIVAFIGALPVTLTDRVSSIDAVQFVDAATDAQHRRSGLFGAAMTWLTEALAEHGIAAAFVVPNQNSERLLPRLGWRPVVPIRRYSISVRTGLPQLLTRLLRGGAAAARNAHPRGRVPAPSTAGAGTWVARSEAYCHRKMTVGGSWVTRLHDTSVWMKGRGTLVIGDMDIPRDARAFDDVMESLRRLAWRQGVRRIEFQASAGTPLDDRFSARWSPQPSWTPHVRTMGARPPLTLDALRLTMADIDAF